MNMEECGHTLKRTWHFKGINSLAMRSDFSGIRGMLNLSREKVLFLFILNLQ